MPKRLLHLRREVTRFGKVKWWVRIGHGQRIRLPDQFGTPEFYEAYRAALAGKAIEIKPAKSTGTGSLAWLIENYMSSAAWSALSVGTRKEIGLQFSRLVEQAGSEPFAEIKRRHILEGRDRRREKPTDANRFVKACRMLFEFALDRELVDRNPALGVKAIARPNAEAGFHTWTSEEIEKFEARWPLGSRERLALDLAQYTGLRVSDLCRVGRQHDRNGILTIMPEKTKKHGTTVTIEVVPALAASIAATKVGDLTFLVSLKDGMPITEGTFCNWFKKACVAAGVPGSAHGIRKASAVRVAEAGASEATLNAVFGWKQGSGESATYIRKADRAKLARNATSLLVRNANEKSHTGV